MASRIRIPGFHYLANRVLRWLFPRALKLHIEGLEKIPPKGALIAAVNHTNFLDPVLGAAYLRDDVLPIAKVELFRFPLNLVFANYGAFPVRRGEADLGAMKRALQVLYEEHVMLISPEGTRTKSGTLQTAREGTALLAIKSKAPILPVAMWGGKKFWDNLAHLRRTEVGVRIGEPLMVLPIDSKPSREVLRAITDEIMIYIAKLLPPEYRGVYGDIQKVVPRYVVPVSVRQEEQAGEKEVMALGS